MIREEFTPLPCPGAGKEKTTLDLEGCAERRILKTDAKIVRYPDRYSDQRGERMWSAVRRIVADLEREEVRHG